MTTNPTGSPGPTRSAKVDHAAEARAWLARSSDPALVHAVLAVVDAIDGLSDTLTWFDRGTYDRPPPPTPITDAERARQRQEDDEFVRLLRGEPRDGGAA